MDEICQSCGMPLGNESMKGTNKDGSKSDEYCMFCFKDGEFTADLTLDEFIEKQVKVAVDKMGMEESDARTHAKNTLPHLNRWKK